MSKGGVLSCRKICYWEEKSDRQTILRDVQPPLIDVKAYPIPTIDHSSVF